MSFAWPTGASTWAQIAGTRSESASWRPHQPPLTRAKKGWSDARNSVRVPVNGAIQMGNKQKAQR